MLGAFTAAEIAAFEAVHDLIQILPQVDGDLDAAYTMLEEIQNDPLKAKQAQIKGSAFDIFKKGGAWGSSVGVWAGAFALSKQGQLIHDAAMVFPEEMTKPEFIDIPRGLGYVVDEILWHKTNLGTPGINLDYVESAVRGELDPAKRLNVENMLSCEVPFHVVTMDFDTGETVVLNGFKSPDYYFAAAKAASHILGVTGQVTEIDGRRLCDARGNGNSTPIHLVPDNVDAVIVFSPYPADYDLAPDGTAIKRRDALSQCLRVVAKDGEHAERLIKIAKEQRDKAADRIAESRKNSKHLYFGPPEGEPPLSHTCMDTDILRETMIATYLNVIDAFIPVLIKKGLITKNLDAHATFPARWEPSYENQAPQRQNPLQQVPILGPRR